MKRHEALKNDFQAHVRRPKTGVEDDHVQRIAVMLPAHLGKDLAALSGAYAHEIALVSGAERGALAVPMRSRTREHVPQKRTSATRAIGHSISFCSLDPSQWERS
jgi:hypothetical protein